MNNTFFLQKRVLVTGGAGFIGSRIVEHLVKLGACVSVLDNLSTGNMANINSIVNDVVFIHGDITSFQTCLVATQNQSLIFHLAAMANVPDSITQPRTCFNINVRGTYNILEAARINLVKTVIFSSSAAVYGNSEESCNEDMACNPLSPYGLSKLIGEQLCAHYFQLFNVHSICPRYFNVYGARKAGTDLYSTLMEALNTNAPITIFGDGTQTRDFIQVDDVVQANLVLAQLPTAALNGQSVNIASGSPQSLSTFVDKIRQRYPESQSEILYQPARRGDIQHSIASIKKYQELKSII